MLMIAAQWGVGQTLWSFFWFFLFLMWIWLVITVFSDIMRSDDLRGLAKAGWLLGIIVFPYLGVFAYLIIRGDDMSRRQLEKQRAGEAAIRSYIQEASGGSNAIDQLAKLAELRASGTITDEEFQQMKGRIVTT